MTTGIRIFACFSISILLGISIPAFGQRDTIVDNIKYNHVEYYQNGRIKELGNVESRSDTPIKEGYWMIFNDEGELIEKGNFKRNKKCGTWVEKSSEDNCCWTGSYKKGKRHGSWSDGGNRVVYYKKGQVKGSVSVSWK